MKPVVAASLLFVLGCSSSTRTIKIPESVVQRPGNEGQGRTTPQPYVVKMSDGQRTWQIEVPGSDQPGGFETVIPLDQDPNGPLGQVSQSAPSLPQTEADREIIEAKKQKGEPIAQPPPGAQPKTASYLATIARARELYKRRQYELALMDIVELDRMYPDDERVLEMKGTLYLKLNRPSDAKKAWERVLALNPNNQGVARALEQLQEETE